MVRLASPLAAAIDAGVIELAIDSADPDTLLRTLVAVGDVARSEAQELALARLWIAAGALGSNGVGAALERAADHAERTFDWGRAGAHRVQAARAHLLARTPRPAFAAAALALAALRAAGGGPALAEVVAAERAREPEVEQHRPGPPAERRDDDVGRLDVAVMEPPRV